MRKFFMTTMTAAMLFCLTGCGNNDVPGTNDAENNTVTETPMPTAEPTAADSEHSSNDNVTETAVNKGEFKIGAYAGNAVYETEGFSMSWIFTANFREDGTFTLVNDAGEEKGSGTYALADSYYTMSYSDGRTGSFVVLEDGSLMAMGDFPYGQASISSDTVGGLVLTYGITETSGYSLAAGTYKATYTKESAMAGTVVYEYSAELGEDGTFSYSVTFAMGETVYDGSAANGTYTLNGTTFLFTDSDGNVTEGTVTGEDTLTIALMASAMAKEPYEVTFTK